MIASPAGEGEAPFRLPASSDDWLRVPTELCHPGRRLTADQGAPGAPSPQQVGETLFRALFAGPVGLLFAQSRGVVTQQEQGLRVRLRFRLDLADPWLTTLHGLPWELLYDPETRDFLALNRRTPLVRSLDVPRPQHPLPLPGGTRLLVAMADAPGYPLDLQSERHHLEEVWAGIPNVEVLDLERAGLAALREALLTSPIHILHLMGHGEIDPATSSGVLVFPGPDGSRLPVTGETLAHVLKDFSTLRLVFLNACDTGRIPAEAEPDPLSGVATALVLGGVPAVVTMQLPVADDAAIAFSRTVYDRLAHGDPLDTAVTEGRHAIHSLHPETVEWAIPVLFTRISEGRIFTRSGAPEPAAVQLGDPTLRSIDRPLGPLAPGDPAWIAYSMYDDIHGGHARGDSERPKLVAPSAHIRGVPPVPELFLGREQAMNEFKQILGIQDRNTRRIAAISGWPGLGKSTFVSVLARNPEILAAFPDGVLWMSLGQEPRLLTQLTRWGEWLGDASLFRVTTLDECLARLASLLQPLRVLLLVDDVWNQRDATGFIRLAEAGTSVVVTTRLPAVAAALVETPESHYRLPSLTEDDGLRMLAVLAPDAVHAHPRECRELVGDLEQLPLALHVVGRMLHAESRLGLDVRELIAEIRSGEGLLDRPAPADTMERAGMPIPTVSALLEKSTRLLSEEIRDRFAYLGVMAPKPATFDLEALKTLWQTVDPSPTVRELVGRGLLEPLSSGRFQMHPLLISHALSLLS